MSSSCVFRTRQQKSEKNKWNTTKLHKNSPKLFSLYSELFFMAICDCKKSSFEPFVYSARLFLLLIDFLLHIMGIQIRIKARWCGQHLNTHSLWVASEMHFKRCFGFCCVAKKLWALGGKGNGNDAIFRRKRKWKFINSACYWFLFFSLLHSHVIPLESILNNLFLLQISTHFIHAS